MNSVARIEQRPPAKPQPKPGAIAAQVLGAEAKLLSTADACAKASSAWIASRKLSEEDGPSAHVFARRLELLASEQQLCQLREDVERSLAAAPDERLNRILIGLMTDCFAVGREAQPETYAEALSHDLQDRAYAPAVVARALQEIRQTRKSEFRPTIAEVLERCDEAKLSLASIPRTLALIEDDRTKALRGLERERSRPPTGPQPTSQRPAAGAPK